MKGNVRKRFMYVALVMMAVLALVIPAVVGAEEVTPIPSGGDTVLPVFIGAPAKAYPLPPPQVPRASRNPGHALMSQENAVYDNGFSRPIC